MQYRVQTFRDAGLESRWGRNRHGAPIIVVRDPDAKHAHQRNRWWACDCKMFTTMQTEGVREGFDQWTLLGGILSVPA